MAATNSENVTEITPFAPTAAAPEPDPPLPDPPEPDDPLPPPWDPDDPDDEFAATARAVQFVVRFTRLKVFDVSVTCPPAPTVPSVKALVYCIRSL